MPETQVEPPQTKQYLLNADKKASVISDINDSSDQAFYFFPGCRTDSESVKEGLDPLVSEIGSTHYVNYPKKDFSLESIKQEVLAAREQDGQKPATILAHSMGGMVISKLLTDKDFREKFGPIESIVFDSSPSSYHDVRRSVRTVTKVAKYLLRQQRLHDFLSDQLSNQTLHQSVKEHDYNLTDEMKSRLLQKTAATPIETALDEAQFIKNTKLPDNALKDIEIDRLIYIDSRPDEADQESKDDIIDTKSAHRGFERIFGRKVVHLHDRNRPEKSHAASVDFPHVTTALLRDTQGDYALKG